jgi:hypothetical protein
LIGVREEPSLTKKPEKLRDKKPSHIPGRAGGGWEEEEHQEQEEVESEDEVLDFGTLTLGKYFYLPHCVRI